VADKSNLPLENTDMYKHIATVSCKHAYYKDTSFRAVSFSIAEDSIKLFNDLGIILKKFTGGFHLLSASPELLISENNENSFKFYLNCSDPYYINFTNLPDEFSPIRDVFYFNNISTHKSSTENSYSLQKSTFVGKNDVCQLSHSTIRIPAFDSLKTYSFQDSLDSEIPKECIIEPILEYKIHTISNLREGLINIKLKNEVVHCVYYAPNVIWKKPLGIVELFTDTLFHDFKANKKADYIINYNNRTTIWKYFLTGLTYQGFEFDQLRILDKKKELIFENPQKQLIENNTEAIVFCSKNKIPFQEFTDDNFQLLIKGETVIKSMPQASPEHLFSEKTNDKKILYYSHIYVH
jgi:hypothetical protein